MFRYLLASIILVATLSFTGCILGPCGGGHCHDCDGASACEGHYAHSPGDSFRKWRRGLSCGAGCGEVYYDEWSSTPPDCVDPCPDFGGDCGGPVACGCGVASCRGGCGFQPLRAVGRLVVGIYGKRFCGDCGHSFDACGCDAPHAVYEGEISGGGCADGNCGLTAPPMSQIVSSTPDQSRHSAARQQMLTRQAMARASTRKATEREAIAAQRTTGSASNKFYRQASQAPTSNQALRR